MGIADDDFDMLRHRARLSFTPAAPINEANLFAGRKKQIRRLLDTVTERGRHAVLYGERGVGKTSLVNIFHMLMEGGVIIRPIRKQSSPSDDYYSIWKEVFRAFTFEIKKDGDYGKEEQSIFTIADLYRDKITPDDVVRELSKAPKDILPVIIFDEFDKISDTNTKKMMSHTIKALSDTGVNATIIIVGVANDIDTLVEEHESVKRNLEEIKMPRMSDEELNEILTERLPKLGVKINATANNKIVKLSRGLPEYVHLLGRNAVICALEDKRKHVMDTDVSQAIINLITQSEQSTNQIYKLATHTNKKNAIYKQVLLACALAETDDEGQFTPASIINPLTKILHKKNKIAIGGFQSHLTAFCTEKRGQVLEKHGAARSYKYRFREPKMQPYVIMQGIASRDIDQDALDSFLSN